MDEFPGLLARDFGFKPQGKAAPMAPSRANNSSFGLGSNASDFSKSSSLKSTPVFDDHDRDGHLFNDVFGGPPKYSSTSGVDSRSGNSSSFDYDSIFKDQKNLSSNSSKANSAPVYDDKPVYDDDIFEGLPGLRSSSMRATAAAPAASFDDVFASISTSSPKHKSARESSAFDDLLGNLGKKETESRVKSEKNATAFDDLLPGFGSNSSPSRSRSTSQSNRSQKPPSNSTKTASTVLEDPFVVLESTSTPMGSSSEVFTSPLEEIGKFGGSGSAKADGSSVSGGAFDDLDPLNGLGKSVPPVSPEINKRENDRSPLRSKSTSGTQTHPSKEPIDRSSMEYFEGYAQNRTPVDNFQGSNETLFDMPSAATDSLRSAGRAASPPSYMSATDSFRSAARATSPPSYPSATDDSLRSAGRATSPPSYTSASNAQRSAARATSPPSYTNVSPGETNSQVNTTPKSEEVFESADDVWLTVSEIPLFTQPTSAPPPSRPPPPRPTRVSKLDTANARKKANEYASFSNSPQYNHSPKSSRAGAKSSAASQIDELEDFAMGRSWNNVNGDGDGPSGEDLESSVAAASAAAMKDAMDRAEAKFRHAKEMRERESFRTARSRESFQPDKEERAMQQDTQEKFDREMQQREHEEEQRRLEREKERARESEREREEKEREQRRIEKERERAREIEKEREMARHAVERATREARERAAAEARLKAERAAVEKANAAARERAERAAVQRAQAEARERAAADARERAEKAAAEARERANAEAREKEAQEKAAVAKAEAEARRRAERAAVERAAAEARERAAAEARERAATAARTNQNQQKNDNDLESFFSSRPSSAPRPRANTSDPLFDTQSKGGPEPARRTSVGVSSNMKKASSTTNIVDDLSSIFGAASGPSAGEFQEVEGETEERRRARLERHQRTQERAAKALAEKNQRDLQAQRDQAERHRIAETLDVEIKRWASGKEGNIRALLATLQYVLWPECGWQPVSLTDLITAAAVKKVYRKATLCIHPDKVQQKGANLQQKYIAEKVFDLLKEAWNKFNSEELF